VGRTRRDAAGDGARAPRALTMTRRGGEATERRPNPDEEWQLWADWLGEGTSMASIRDDVLAMLAARQIWDSFRLVGEGGENSYGS
jgi:hypothetical protein